MSIASGSPYPWAPLHCPIWESARSWAAHWVAYWPRELGQNPRWDVPLVIPFNLLSEGGQPLAEALHGLYDSVLKFIPAGALISLDLWAGVCREPSHSSCPSGLWPCEWFPSERQPVFCSGSHQVIGPGPLRNSKVELGSHPLRRKLPMEKSVQTGEEIILASWVWDRD